MGSVDWLGRQSNSKLGAVARIGSITTLYESTDEVLLDKQNQVAKDDEMDLLSSPQKTNNNLEEKIKEIAKHIFPTTRKN